MIPPPPVSPVVNEVWREQTLNRLLNLVELPLLEGVLQYNQSPPTPPRSAVPAHRNPDLIFSSNHLDRQILEAFKDSQWVELKKSHVQNSSFTVLRAVDTEWTYLQANDQMTFKKCSLQEGKKKKRKWRKIPWQTSKHVTPFCILLLWCGPSGRTSGSAQLWTAWTSCPISSSWTSAGSSLTVFNKTRTDASNFPSARNHKAKESVTLHIRAVGCALGLFVAPSEVQWRSSWHFPFQKVTSCTAFLYKCLSLKETSYFIPLLYSRQHCNMNLKK